MASKCGDACGSSSCPPQPGSITDDVKEYYGKTLQSSQDLQTNVCTMGRKKMPKHVREAMALVNEDVSSRYYGCGLVAPEALEGTRILDLGSGSGQDCFVLSKLVGENGHVTGLDMTEEQLEVAIRNIEHHQKAFGYSKPNVNFIKGYMENLKEAGLEDGAFDIIISNCVINLSPDKRAVLAEARRVLKDGGELYFSDVYADRELSDEIRKNKVLWGECISGALYWITFMRLAAELGFSQPRLVTAKTMDIGNEELKQAVGDAKFVSATYRLFKLPEEKQSQRNVIYEGGILGCEDKFALDHHLAFPKGQPVFVDDEVSTILWSSRFKDEFTFEPISKCFKPSPPSQTKEQMDPYVFSAGGPPPAAGGGCCAAKTTGCC